MVDGCPGGYYCCGSNDAAGTGAPHYISCPSLLYPLFFQLRRASGGFCRFVLVRVVRLTIETNTLTGTYPSLRKLLNGRETNFLLS